MKYLTITLILLSFNSFSQELEKLEHWDDKYNKESKDEVYKTQAFIANNNIKFLEIYNAPKGVTTKFLDKLPYMLYKNMDTIAYFMPGWLTPKSREDFISDLNGPYSYAFFVEGIRKDGRMSVYNFREFRFLRKENKIYYLYVSSDLNREDESKLFNKLLESNSEEERNKIWREIGEHKNYKSELIFDFGNQTEIGDRITPEQKRYSQLLEITETNNRKYFRITTNVTSIELRDIDFVFDNDCNFYLIDGHEIRE